MFLRVGGAMELLLTILKTDTIRLVGMWRSNIILSQLHTTVHTFTSDLAAQMVQHGDYALIPSTHRG